MKKHFMCTHTFHNEDAENAFDKAAAGMTLEMFAMLKNERAEMAGHWRGDDEFFYFHWYAESGDAIMGNRESLGFGDLMMTLPNEVRGFFNFKGDLTKTYAEQLN